MVSNNSKPMDSHPWHKSMGLRKWQLISRAMEPLPKGMESHNSSSSA